MTTFDRVKELAKKRGLSLLQLNDKAKLGKNAIYKWRTSTPGIDSLEKVADVLGVSVSYLLMNDDNDQVVAAEKKVDLTEVAKSDAWDYYLSADGKPLSDKDKQLLRALFGE